MPPHGRPGAQRVTTNPSTAACSYISCHAHRIVRCAGATFGYMPVSILLSYSVSHPPRAPAQLLFRLMHHTVPASLPIGLADGIGQIIVSLSRSRGLNPRWLCRFRRRRRRRQPGRFLHPVLHLRRHLRARARAQLLHSVTNFVCFACNGRMLDCITYSSHVLTALRYYCRVSRPFAVYRSHSGLNCLCNRNVHLRTLSIWKLVSSSSNDKIAPLDVKTILSVAREV